MKAARTFYALASSADSAQQRASVGFWLEPLRAGLAGGPVRPGGDLTRLTISYSNGSNVP